MILSIHQPHFFPWLGYFDKMLRSDVFVYLDNVQFTKNYFQNRTQVKSQDGKTQWITVSVKKAPLQTLIRDTFVSETYDAELLCQKLTLYYRKAAFWEEFSEDVLAILKSGEAKLSLLNIKTVEYMVSRMDNSPKRLVSSELKSQETDANLRLVRICQELNCDVYLAGAGGKKYMDLELFKKEGIEVRFQEFHPQKYSYPQLGSDFIPGLSSLDVLFNIGFKGFNDLICGNLK